MQIEAIATSTKFYSKGTRSHAKMHTAADTYHSFYFNICKSLLLYVQNQPRKLMARDIIVQL